MGYPNQRLRLALQVIMNSAVGLCGTTNRTGRLLAGTFPKGFTTFDRTIILIDCHQYHKVCFRTTNRTSKLNILGIS